MYSYHGCFKPKYVVHKYDLGELQEIEITIGQNELCVGINISNGHPLLFYDHFMLKKKTLEV